MTFPILPSNSPSGFYAIDNSLRFNDDDSPYLSRTPASAGNRKTWTYSFWTKISGVTNNRGAFLDIYTDESNWFAFFLDTTSGLVAKIRLYQVVSGTDYGYTTDALFRDVSAWYHIVVAVDTTQATASNRVKLYINGNQITFNQVFGDYPQNYDTWVNSTVSHKIGRYTDTTKYVDGYMAEVNFIDGQALSPTDFGEFDSDSGIWKPIEYTGTYGTNGFYLDFENSGSLGADQSGNGNNFTPTNLASTDQMLDTPTNNFCTLNPLTPVVTHTLSEANLKSTNSSATHGGANSTINYPTSGKWYHEVRINAEDSSKGQGVAIGSNVYRTVTQWGNYNFLIGYMSDGTLSAQGDAGYTSYGTAHNVGDIIGVAYNSDDQELTFYHNNSSQGVIATSSMDGTLDFNNLCPVVFGRNMGQTFNFGQDSSFAGAETRQNNTDNNGEGDFYYTPPSGYLTLNTSNLATVLSPTIDDGSLYQNQVLYTGTGSARDVTGYGFQPDWVWIKQRSGTTYHRLYDSSRGAGQEVYSNTADAESNGSASQMSAFISDGFSIPTSGGNYTNINTGTYVAWGWKVNSGTTSSNTDGSITSTVQVNTTAGFSIVTYTGTGATDEIGHGLGVAPKVIITKSRTAATDWIFYTTIIDGSLDFLRLNTTATISNSSATAPNSSVFYQATGTENYLAYCFIPIEGYSKFGKYTGNGSTDGTFVYTGFRPQWIMWKRTDSLADWEILDDKINPFNEMKSTLEANTSDTVGTETNGVDMLSNGFKHRNSYNSNNASGGTYIYMAFAESPFVTSTSIPVTAR